jgi:hypothetical protein
LAAFALLAAGLGFITFLRVALATFDVAFTAGVTFFVFLAGAVRCDVFFFFGTAVFLTAVFFAVALDVEALAAFLRTGAVVFVAFFAFARRAIGLYRSRIRP